MMQAQALAHSHHHVSYTKGDTDGPKAQLLHIPNSHKDYGPPDYFSSIVTSKALGRHWSHLFSVFVLLSGISLDDTTNHF